MQNVLNTIVICLLSISVFSCGGSITDDTHAYDANSSSPKRAPYFDFFNDIRADIATLEEDEVRLVGFGEETQKFLESRDAQEKYKIAGFYYEEGLDRTRGAYEYADRFFANGCVIHVVIYPPDQQGIWQSLQGFNKGKGKQVGQNYVFYQVFTANPVDESLEMMINEMIEQSISDHAATIGQLMEP